MNETSTQQETVVPITMKRELITPAVASKMLEINPNNRKIAPDRVKAMAADMKSGRWRETHQGIAQNCDGSLKDGQHRLSAVVASQCSVWMWVARGLSDDDIEVIDTHRPRSISDVMMIGGAHVSKSEVAIGRMMMTRGLSSRKFIVPPRAEIIKFVDNHIKAIRFALSLVPKGRFTHACVMAPIARAYYTQDHDRLAEFGECLKTGIVSSENDTAAVMLVRLLTINRPSIPGGAEVRTSLYRKATASLVAFLDRRPLTKLYEHAAEAFTIPNDYTGEDD